jgi:hypothetical protein
MAHSFRPSILYGIALDHRTQDGHISANIFQPLFKGIEAGDSWNWFFAY